jgi:GTP-binding protein Era
MPVKAGFVSLIGKPNAGKSTIFNAFLESKLSIVSPKPQTTRKEVVGILTENDCQIVLLDTPGLIKPKYKLQEVMMEYVPTSLESSDVVLVVFDYLNYSKTGKLISKEYLTMIEQVGIPKIAILNKIDLVDSKIQLIPLLTAINNLNLFDEIVPLSAKDKTNLDTLKEVIIKYLPESHFYYDEESLSTLNTKFFAAEIIREKIFLNTEEEIPYSAEVQIQEFIERENGKWFISADIILEKQSQKQILIGKNGSMIKQISSEARIEIEKFLDYPVFLELFVKVRKDWRNNTTMLKSYGY